MTKYNEAQVDFRERSKGRIQRQLEISEWLPHTCSSRHANTLQSSLYLTLTFFQLGKQRRTKNWRRCWRAAMRRSSLQGYVICAVCECVLLVCFALASGAPVVRLYLPPLFAQRRSWTPASPNKPWVRSNPDTRTSSAWRAASKSCTTCL